MHSVDSLLVHTGVSVIDSPKKRQDRASVHSFIVQKKKCILAGVYDGHGIHGEGAASAAQQTLKQEVEFNLLWCEEPAGYIEHSLVHGLCEAEKSIKEDQELSCSGTTATVACLYKNMLHVANVGNSRAVIGRFKDGFLSSFQPLPDHSCYNESEAARIGQAGKDIVVSSCARHGSFNTNLDKDWECPQSYESSCCYRRCVNDGGVLTPYTRSLEGCLFSFDDRGIIGDPEATMIKLCRATDRFVILASDGVWNEYLRDPITNNQAVLIVSQVLDEYGYGDDGAQKAASTLAQEAFSRWPSESADDISVVVLALNWDE